MVNWISSWAKGIIMAVIIGTIIEMIIPEGNNKKYIKLVIGVYVLFSVITPIISVIKGKEFEFNEDDYKKYFESTYEDVSVGISEVNDNNIEKIYETNIKNDIKQKLENKGYLAKEISIEIQTSENNYGNINKMVINVVRNEKKISESVNNISINKVEIDSKNEKQKDDEKSNLTNLEIKDIKKYLSDTYNVAEKYIQIN